MRAREFNRNITIDFYYIEHDEKQELLNLIGK